MSKSKTKWPRGSAKKEEQLRKRVQAAYKKWQKYKKLAEKYRDDYEVAWKRYVDYMHYRYDVR